MKVFVGFIVLLSCIMVVAGSGAYSFASIQELPPVDPVRDKLGKVLPVLKEPESGDCEGTVYKKRGVCKSVSGDILDGSEGKCGEGKVSWALDVKDPGYKAEFGPLGECPNFEELRDCEVPCPRPCEGDTWKKGKCVQKDANGKVTVLDGTKGKCGDGILDLQLDTTAADYKPAVGSGTCITKKEGACFVKCPKPELPKCSYVTAGWQKNDLGCVTSKTPAADGSYTGVSCGQSGWRQEYKASTLNTEKCDTLTRWLACKAPPCPIDCVGSWSDWTACTLPAGEVCGITKTKQTYRVTREKNSTGKACPERDGKPSEKVCGQSQSVSCCTKGNWQNVGEPLSTGKQKQKRTVVGCDPTTTPKVREVDACYKGPWVNKGCIGKTGKRKETRAVVGTKCDFNTKSERTLNDCPIDCEGSWNNPVCPTACGKPASTLTKTWTTTVQPKNGGKACPQNESFSCPATRDCMFEAPYCKADTNENNCRMSKYYGLCSPGFGDKKGCNSVGSAHNNDKRCRDVCNTTCGRTKDGCRTDPKWCKEKYAQSFHDRSYPSWGVNKGDSKCKYPGVSMEVVCNTVRRRDDFCAHACAEAGYAPEPCTKERLWMTDAECRKYPEVCRLAKLNPTYKDDNIKKRAREDGSWWALADSRFTE